MFLYCSQGLGGLGLGWKEDCLLGKQHIGVLGIQALYFSLRVGFSDFFLKRRAVNILGFVASSSCILVLCYSLTMQPG